jgi:hypothetical protein
MLPIAENLMAALWEWTIPLRALPQALGGAWFVRVDGLTRIGLRNRLLLVAMTLLGACLGVFCDSSNRGTETRSDADGATPAIPSSQSAPYAPDTKIAYTSSACNIESINHAPFGTETVTVPKTSPLFLAGWAYDEIAKQPSKSLYVVLLDTTGTARYFFAGAPATPRIDVSQYLHLPDLVNAGFEASLSLAAVETGKYHVVLGVAGTSDFRFCDVGRWISVQ